MLFKSIVWGSVNEISICFGMYVYEFRSVYSDRKRNKIKYNFIYILLLVDLLLAVYLAPLFCLERFNQEYHFIFILIFSETIPAV